MKTTYWGTYGPSRRMEHAGWFIEIAPFTYSAPEEWAGKTSWRYRMSRNRIVPGIWTDRNPRARKFETRCFVSLQDATEAARTAASKA